jgi:hypothetical protein
MLIRTQRRAFERRGSIIVLAAVFMIIMVGAVAIVMDGGLMMDDKRHEQAAADMAAMSAASQLYYMYATYAGADHNSLAYNSAIATATGNGFTEGTNNSHVTVNIPPTSGLFIGQTGYAEVIISYDQPRMFSRVYGSTALTTTARAVARAAWNTNGIGILLLDPTDRASLKVNGNGSARVTGSRVVVDSNNVFGGELTSNGSMYIEQGSYFSGPTPGYDTTGSGVWNGDVYVNQPPMEDPLLYLPYPDPNSLTVQKTNKLTLSGNKSATLDPGIYQGGISIQTSGDVTMNPGIYYMTSGGFSLSGQGGVTGNGVMIFNYGTSSSDTFSITGSGNVHLTPPTTGPYTGVTYFQNRTSNATVTINGGGNIYLTGTFYAAHGDVQLTGNGGGGLFGSQWVSYTMGIGGNGDLTIDYDAGPTAHIRVIQLVE